MRAAGYNKGVPDMFIYEPSLDGEYVGLALELKSAKGRPTPQQLKWLADLQNRGWCAAIVKSVDECKAITMRHLYNK